ncbi:hypothetical protein BKA65DRAFT_493928 [Rhexocercosporidium sp. MPI-PUGE-AT-0058]|nr:hypothetical protein BKA65DRAFT_493928 [Rhexocercosporidium sp. MPI-PUGE-AT-0058]
MSSPHICLTCRRTVNQIRPAVVQWRSRATFISLSNNKSRKPAGREPRDDQLGPAEDLKKRDDGPAARASRKKPTQARATNPGDVLESLFEKTIHPSPPKDDEPLEAASALEPYQRVHELNKMMDNEAPFPDQWAFFLEHFGPAAQRARGRDRISMPSYLRPTIKLMFKAIVQAKEKHHPLPDSLPSTTEISRVFMELGYLNANDWIEMVSHPLRFILKARNGELHDPELEKRLTEDLIGAWNIVCRDIGQLRNFHDKDSPSYWMTLPSISMVDAVHVHQKRGSQDVFALLVPSFKLGNLKAFPMIALATFGLLSERSVDIESLNIDLSPLLMVLSRIISIPGLDRSNIHSSYSLLNVNELLEYVKDNWSAIRERAAAMSQYHHPQIDKTKAERTSRASVRISVRYINRRLHEAYTTRNLRQVDEIWSDVSQWPVDTSGVEGPPTEQGKMSLALANYLILVYMSLRQPNRAIDVWNHMVNNDLTPTLRTWDSMMSGCVAAKDVKALEQVWAKMRNSQVVPDVICWATIVGGLITCRKADAGVAKLDEMGRIWIEAAKKKYPNMAQSEVQLMTGVEGAVKPSIEVINAAIGGLFRSNLSNAAHKILAWAGKFGIAPNVDTYNILLRSLIREERSKEAMALLQRMHKTGVQPDSHTFTAILDETFRSMEALTPEETTAIVQSVFSEMKSAGVKPTVQIYGKIIRQLLPDDGQPADMATINAVVETMYEQGIDANAHIYTMLLEHHFAQIPPNMNTIRNMIERASNTQGGTDEIFWDRAIEGYARNNETGPAMRILGKVQASKGKVGWTAMRLLLLALVENQEWELARTLVNNAVIDNGAPVPVEGQGVERQLNWEFWRLARSFGLVEQGPELKAQYLENPK